MAVIINDISPWTQLVATAAQTIFNTTWTADDITDVVVYARADGVAADDLTQVIAAIDYTVTLVGGSETVRVTFGVGRTNLDVITIVRNTPADRANLYTNTNFTPSMLNGDFGRHTMVEQQNKLYWNIIGPRYETSGSASSTRDLKIPVLTISNVWRMNDAGTAIENFELLRAVAYFDSTYVLNTPDANLPNSQALSANPTGYMASVTGTGLVSTRVLTGSVNQINVSNGTGTVGNPAWTLSSTLSTPGTFTVQATSPINAVLDEGNLGSNSATALATQQSIKSYVDTLAINDVQSVTGTANQIDVNNGDPKNPILSLPATVVAPGTVAVGNMLLDTNTLSSTDVNGDINVTPNATGSIVLDGQSWPQADGTSGQIIGTNGAGQLSYVNGLTMAGPSTDNAVPRFDGIVGDLQDSGVILDDANIMTGLSQIYVGLLRITGNTFLSTTANTDIRFETTGSGDFRFNGKIELISSWLDLTAAGVVDPAIRGTDADISLEGDAWIRTNTGVNSIQFLNNIDAVILSGSNAGVVTMPLVNLGFNANEIVSTDANGDLSLTPNLAGNLILDGVSWPQAGGAAGEVLQIDGAGQTSWQPGGNGEFVGTDYNQGGHPFTTGQAVRSTGVATFATAQADSATNAEVIGVIEVIDANNFTVVTAGRVSGFIGLTASSPYYLSEITPGLLTLTPPSAVGEVNKPVMIADSATTGVIIPYRGLSIGGTPDSNGASAITVLTASANWVKPAGFTGRSRVIVQPVGAGGGGGAVGAAGSGTARAGGGGGGGMAILMITNASLGATEVVTIGAAGAAGTAGGGGGTGGTTSFGAHVSATGGGGGGGQATRNTTIQPGGRGSVVAGTGISGTVNLVGSHGHTSIGFNTTALGGDGGSSPMGGGGQGGYSNNVPQAGRNYGGGGGGSCNPDGAARDGAAGAQGVVIVYEFE